MPANGHAPATPPDRKTLIKVSGAAIVGSVLEWYDYFLYGTAAALVFSTMFFPEVSQLAGTLAAFATFAVGFAARPLGAVLFGNLGDRIGRKPTLVIILIIMGVATTSIGLLPSYAAIGIWAPIALVVLRVIQGCGAGAEFTGAAIFTVEYAPPTRRGLYGALPAAGVMAGLVLSSGTVTLLTLFLSESEFISWGWRIPFIASILLVAAGLYIRLRIDETPIFREAAQEDRIQRVPVAALFRDQWRDVLLGTCVVAAPIGLVYIYQVYALSYMTKQLDISQNTASTAITIGAIAAVIGSLVFGALSDKVGRRAIFIGGALFSALAAFPFMWLITTGNPLAVTIAVFLTLGIGVSFMFGPQGAFLAELFGAGVRYSGFAISREVSSMIFGGLPPFLAAGAVAAAGGSFWPVATGAILLCAITITSTAVLSRRAARLVQIPA